MSINTGLAPIDVAHARAMLCEKLARQRGFTGGQGVCVACGAPTRRVTTPSVLPETGFIRSTIFLAEQLAWVTHSACCARCWRRLWTFRLECRYAVDHMAMTDLRGIATDREIVLVWLSTEIRGWRGGKLPDRIRRHFRAIGIGIRHNTVPPPHERFGVDDGGLWRMKAKDRQRTFRKYCGHDPEIMEAITSQGSPSRSQSHWPGS